MSRRRAKTLECFAESVPASNPIPRSESPTHILRIGAVAAVAALAAALTACKNSQSAGPPPAMPPTPVTVETARATSLEDASEYVATLKSLRSTTVQPQTDGQITQIF